MTCDEMTRPRQKRESTHHQLVLHPHTQPTLAMTTQAAQNPSTDVLIVGAGPTGLTAANVLARYGINFRLVERDDGPIPMEESRALAVQARTLEFFDLLGIGAEADRRGMQVDGITLFIYGKQAGRLPLQSREGEAARSYMLTLPQGDTQRLLLEALAERGAEPEWETTLTGLETDGDGATATLRRADGSEETVRARYVIGADGASSRVREALGLSFEGDTYQKRFFLVDCDVDWPQEHGELYLNMTKDYFLALFPMAGEGRKFHIIGNTSPEMDEGGVTVENVERLLRDEGLAVRLSNPRWASGYKLHRRMVSRLRSGPVFLAGDAAHVHSPAGGQGMNTGIGDALNLAWKLGAVCAGHARPNLLGAYNAERLPVARHVLETTDRNFEFETTDNPVYKRLKLLVAPLAARFIRKTEFGRGHLFDLISQIGIAYPDSPIVEAAAGVGRGPAPGERAPYGEFEARPHAGTNLFAQFSADAHHLLLFEGQEGGSGDWQQAFEAAAEHYAASIHVHAIAEENRALHKSYDAEQPRAYLVRPDGHIGYRGGPEDAQAFQQYLDNLFLPRAEVGASA